VHTITAHGSCHIYHNLLLLVALAHGGVTFFQNGNLYVG
jgi:hypothetical protein